MTNPPFVLITHHGTVVCADPASGDLVHRPIETCTPNLAFTLSEDTLRLSDVFEPPTPSGAILRMIEQMPLKVEFTNGKTSFGFKIDGLYACAEQNDGTVTFSRTILAPWEIFSALGINAFYEAKIAAIGKRGPGAPEAMRAFHLGDFKAALELFGETAAAAGMDDEDFSTYRRQIRDSLAPPLPRGAAVMWRSRPGWELDWLAFLLPPMPELERDTPFEMLAGRSLVVIDNFISAEKIGFYRQAYEAGCDITLIHCSDESFIDDHRVYRWCRSVFRNCFSPLLQRQSNVSFFALGYKTGFAREAPPLPAASRTHVWSFAGDPNKTTRPAMLEAMRDIPGGAEHLISGFGAAESLDTNSYRTMMENSLFIPCPQGFVNLDSFRVYEALEAGCIPIVERRPNFDYFEGLLGRYPFPSVYDWREAGSLIDHLQTHGLVDALAASCGRWWYEYKLGLKARLYQAIFK